MTQNALRKMSGQQTSSQFTALHFILVVIFLTLSSIRNNASCQDTLSRSLDFWGYLETYYQHDFNRPSGNSRPDFIYSHHRVNEVTLNLGVIGLTYKDDIVRGNLALMAGTYTNANLAHEPGVLKNIFEANAGLKLLRKYELWLDAGIIPSHIGFESAIGSDCWTLSRSLLADNSPYYEAGAKLSYMTPDHKWFFAGLLLNGWQRIQRINAQTKPNFGTQITFSPSKRITVNSSFFIGSDNPDSLNSKRIFHNFYAIWSVTRKIGITMGLDAGRENLADDYAIWFSPVLIGRMIVSQKISTAMRLEYFSDQDAVIVKENNFEMFGASLNIDLKISDNMMFRCEAKTMNGPSYVFLTQDQPIRHSVSFSGALTIGF